MRRLVAFVFGCLTLVAAQASSAFGAERLAIDGKAPYPNLVVGTITAIATPDELARPIYVIPRCK
jgi:hypothetical protein